MRNLLWMEHHFLSLH